MSSTSTKETGPYRNDWIFWVEVNDLKEATKTKVAYHKDRLKVWKQEQSSVEQDIKDRGFQVTAHEITGGHRADVQIDPGLLKRLTEAQTKIEKHKNKLEEYESWLSAFKSKFGTGTTSFKLDISDVRYFGL